MKRPPPPRLIFQPRPIFSALQAAGAAVGLEALEHGRRNAQAAFAPAELHAGLGLAVVIRTAGEQQAVTAAECSL